MVTTKVIVLTFDKGYHVGWREPRKIVDHKTILRALIYVARLINAEKCIERFVRGELGASALLPTIVLDNEVRLLAPFPRIPCLGKAARIRGLFVTLSTLKCVLDFIAKCVNAEGAPVAQEVVVGKVGNSERVAIKCVDGLQMTLELERIRGVVCLGKECDEVKPHVPEEFFSIVSEYRNRIDRLSGAADVYEVYGVKPFTPLWLAFRGDKKAVDCCLNLLEVLQRLGIGGLRSRGWGKFKIGINMEVKSDDENVVTSFGGWSKGFNYLLGLALPGNWVDVKKSYATRDTVMGISGPPMDEYRLPLIYAMDVGSVVYAKDIPNPQILTINNGRAVIVFNPVVIHA